MKFGIIYKIFVCLILFFYQTSASASPVSIKAKLDSVQLLMGNMTTLHLEIVEDKNTKGEFPIFRNIASTGFVGVNGDSIELRGIVKADTIDLGSNRLQINCIVPLQSFDSGLYQIPPFEYVAGKDTIWSNSLALKVVPVKVGENDEISDFMPVEEPLNPSIFDKLPDWVVDYWWLLLLILLLILVLVYLVIQYRKTGKIIPVKKKELPPYEVAMTSLKKLKEKKLWEQGLEREYFTELTEVLRVYLQARFEINAMEMTSRQIIETLHRNEELKNKSNYIKQILDIADFVKFAKLRPMPSENTEAYDNAVSFVEETKPKEVDENKNVVIGKEDKQ